MFPCNVARATTTDVISGGMAGTINGALQLVNQYFLNQSHSGLMFGYVIVNRLNNLRADECGATSFVSVGSGSQC